MTSLQNLSAQLSRITVHRQPAQYAPGAGTTTDAVVAWAAGSAAGRWVARLSCRRTRTPRCRRQGMADKSGLGKSGGAGGIDVERATSMARRPLLLFTERFAGMGFDFKINSPPWARFVAMQPDCGKHRE